MCFDSDLPMPDDYTFDRGSQMTIAEEPRGTITMTTAAEPRDETHTRERMAARIERLRADIEIPAMIWRMVDLTKKFLAANLYWRTYFDIRDQRERQGNQPAGCPSLDNSPEESQASNYGTAPTSVSNTPEHVASSDPLHQLDPSRDAGEGTSKNEKYQTP